MFRKCVTGIIAVMMCAGAFATVSQAADAKPAYVGVKSCVGCHKSRDNSVEKWNAAGHSNAFAALTSDKAKKFSKDPANDPKCLNCHTVGFNDNGGYSVKMSAEDKEKFKNVGCENCHGPGSDYRKVMMKAMKGNFDKAAAVKAGLVIPNEKTCLTCHNKQSPSFKPFDFAKRWAEIKHGEKTKK